MNLNEVSPPGWGHTKAEKEKTNPNKPKSKIGGTAAAFKRALDDGRFKGLPGSKTKKEKTADMFKLMWSMKKKGDKPHYKPGTDKKYKKYQEETHLDEGSLRKWFKGSKSKDGKGGWVNVVTGGTCASDEPGEGTPKCVSSAKRASMTKAERLSASRRKKAADPGQQQKTGAAKPTYVRTDSKKKMKEETAMQDNNLYGDAYAGLKRKIGSKKKHNKPAVKEGVISTIVKPKKKEERKPKKAMDAGARAKRMLARRVHAHYVSGSEDNVPDDIREPDKVKEAKEVKLETKKNCGCGQDPCVTYGNKELTQVQKVDEACWKGYKAYGMKKKGGKMVPNCKPVGSVKEAKIDDVKYSKDEKRKNYETDVHTLSSNKGVRSDRNKRRSATDVVFHGHSKVERDRKQAHYKSRGVKKVKGVKEEVVAEADKKGKGSGTKDACYHKVKASAKVWPSAYASGRLVQCRKKGAANYGKSKSEGFEGWVDNTILEKTAAWTRKEGKNKEGGLNEKGRKSYEKANPGSDLKAPQPEGGSRKKSFCARMGGMKKKLTSAKTANDPDSRINKALRKWKC